MPLCCLCHLLCSLWRRWGRGSGTAPHTQVGQWQVMQVASFSSNVGTFWISNISQGTISSPARELWSHVRSCITSLSLLACVWLWNIVCGPDRVVCDYLLMCEVMQCLSSCRRLSCSMNTADIQMSFPDSANVNVTVWNGAQSWLA